jgi:hypothetical protein
MNIHRIVERIKVGRKAGCMIGKHSNDGNAEPRDALGRKFACCLCAICVCVSLLSLIDIKTVPVPIMG